MPRRNSIKLDLSEDALVSLLNEIYSEATQQRLRSITTYNKWLKEYEEKQDIALIGKNITDLLKLVDGSIDKKINLAKIIKEVVTKNEKVSDETGDKNKTVVLSEENKAMVQAMLRKQKGE